MSKFDPSQDGKTVDGRIVVFLPVPPAEQNDGVDESKHEGGQTTSPAGPDAAGAGQAAGGSDSQGGQLAAGDGTKQGAGPATPGVKGKQFDDSKGAGAGDAATAAGAAGADAPKKVKPLVLPPLSPDMKVEAQQAAAAALENAAASGVPFCAACDQLKRERAAAALRR